MSRRVLIAGCGYVGTALALQLAERGDVVFALRRRPIPLAPGVSTIGLDLAQPFAPEALPPQIDTVVYAASADSRSEDAYRRAYVGGPLHLIDALGRGGAPPHRFLLLSSTGVYSHADGRWVDEATPTESRGTGAILEEGERRVLSAGVPAIVLRLGGIYGPGRRSLIDRVLSGAAGCPQGPAQYTNRIHLADIVASIEHILGLDAPASLYLGVDDEPADTCTVVRWLAAATGARPPQSVPAQGDRPNKRCRNARLRGSGFVFRYPTFREGYTQVLRELDLLATS